MNKVTVMVAICFVVVTTVIFFIYPYLRYAAPATLSGTYVRYSEHEFGKEWDTLVVAKQTASERSYAITRRWKYERVLDGRTLTPEYKLQKTTGQFLAKESMLVEEESGLRYQFNAKKNELLAGATIYKKIN